MAQRQSEDRNTTASAGTTDRNSATQGLPQAVAARLRQLAPPFTDAEFERRYLLAGPATLPNWRRHLQDMVDAAGGVQAYRAARVAQLKTQGPAGQKLAARFSACRSDTCIIELGNRDAYAHLITVALAPKTARFAEAKVLGQRRITSTLTRPMLLISARTQDGREGAVLVLGGRRGNAGKIVELARLGHEFLGQLGNLA